MMSGALMFGWIAPGFDVVVRGGRRAAQGEDARFKFGEYGKFFPTRDPR